jgi:AraC-like DNA-binding protein
MELESSHLLEHAAVGTYAPETLTWAQLEPGKFEVRYGLLDAGPLRLAVRNMNLGFKGEAQVARQRSVFGITGDSRTRARWHGTTLDQRSVFSSRTAVEISTSGEASFFTISVDESSLAKQFPRTPDALGLLDAMGPIGLADEPAMAGRLRAATRSAFSMGRIPLEMIYGTLVPLLAALTDRGDDRLVESSKCLHRRLAAVRVCEAYMREHADATLTLLDLSQVSGMRSRSLINAFEAVTGYSPMDYLKRIRLNGVHRVLQRHHRDAIRIIDVATDWGFWHMGHFTADYRMMFGETPSQTLLR